MFHFGIFTSFPQALNMRPKIGIVLLLALLCHFAVNGQVREIYLDTDPNNAVRKISFYSPNEGYVAFLEWLGYTTDSGRTMTKIYVTNTNVDFNGYGVNLTLGFDINGVIAFDKNNLLLYGDYGFVPTILSSQNGGANWKVIYWSQYNPSQLHTGVTDMVFPQSDNIGYAVDADRILTTSDKGQTWSVQLAAPGSYFDHIEAVDDNNLIVQSTDAGTYGTSTLWRTTNGGANWTSVSLPFQGQGRLNYATFFTASNGWASMEDQNQNQCFFGTTDGGGTWQQLNDKDADPFGCSKMHFVDANTGYALFAPFEVYKTLNAGVTWEPLPRDNSFTYLLFTNTDLQCLSAMQFWAGGGHGFLEMSTNGGGTPIPTAYFKIDTTGESAAGTVNLLNYSRQGYQYSWYVNNVLISSSYNATYTHTMINGEDSIVLIVSNGSQSDTVKKYQKFPVPVLPTLASFTPTSGGQGTYVTISGTGLTGVTAVAFGGTPVASFTIVNDNTITAVVGAGSSGPVSTTAYQQKQSLPGFVYFPAPTAAAPIITSISPVAGAPGSSVTIAGSSFETGANVYFGTIRATVTSVSATSIVCVVPAGASLGRVNVLNPMSGLWAQSNQLFNLAFADSTNFTGNTFASVWSYSYGPGFYPINAGAADLDGDGKPEVIAATTGYNTYSTAIFLNTSSGGKISFAQPVTLNTFVGGLDYNWPIPDIQDVDGDGKPDLIVSSVSSTLVFKNTSTPGHLSFVQAATIPQGVGGNNGVITDLDGDGLNDIVYAGVSNSQAAICVVRNTGTTGTVEWGAKQAFFGGSNLPESVAAGDLDGDGKKDAVMLDDGGTFVVFRNTSVPGNINFVHTADVAVPGLVLNGKVIVIADMDGNGSPDVVVGNDVNICIYPNISTRGSIQFGPPVVTALPVTGQGASLANFAGGSLPDVLTGFLGYNSQNIYRNLSSKSGIRVDNGFSVPANYTYVTAPADFDGDGKTDILDCNSNSGNLTILQNNMGVPVPFTICQGQIVPYNLGSDINGNSYQWQINRGAGFVPVVNSDSLQGGATRTLTLTNTPLAWNGYTFRCMVDGYYSSTFALQVRPFVPPPIDFIVTDSTICYQSIVFFTVGVGSGNSGSFSYTWQINDSTIDNPSFGNQYETNDLNNGDQVRVILGYGDVCGTPRYDTTRNIIMSVIYPTVTIAASETQICPGEPVTFTATTSNVGTSPGYEWRDNSAAVGTNSPTYTTTSRTGVGAIQLVVDASAFCGNPLFVSSNSIVVPVADSLPPTITITADRTTVCNGGPVNFVAAVAGDGQTQAFEWIVNGTAVAAAPNAPTWAASGLHDQDSVRCVIIGSSMCVAAYSESSNDVSIHVPPTVVPSVSVSAPAMDICPGASVVFTAEGENGGDAPVYLWTRDGQSVGDNSPSFTGGRWTNGETLAVTLVSNAACAIPDTAVSNTLTIELSTTVPTVTISGDSAIVRGEASELTAVVGNAGAKPQYQWEDSTSAHAWQPIGGAMTRTFNYIPEETGDAVRCAVTGAGGCTTYSNVISFELSGTTTIRFFPNPATSVVYILNTNVVDPITALAVTDVNGRKVIVMSGLANEVRIMVDIADLNPGMYFIELWNVSGQKSTFSFQRK